MRHFLCGLCLIEKSLWVCPCIPSSLPGNNTVKTFPRQPIIVGHIAFYATRVVSGESRCNTLWCLCALHRGILDREGRHEKPGHRTVHLHEPFNPIMMTLQMRSRDVTHERTEYETPWPFTLRAIWVDYMKLIADCRNLFFKLII
jgi:hypothetical protein